MRLVIYILNCICQTMRVTKRNYPMCMCLIFFIIITWDYVSSTAQVRQFYCGNDIYNYFLTNCKEYYNRPYKRMGYEQFDMPTLFADGNDLADRTYENKNKGSSFLSNIYEGLMLAKTQNRLKRGVYDECCRKPCTESEISSYCRKV
ncbi:bombyxin A-2 homolog [Musca domestica]|uniref:Bombyxin A-2 homolog n=1 Tax=Musca domestica TaxID=7370 RepID=A0ABM3VIR1_MUSDO|nr:bombyxin A-2 homolog [Musca domestica]